MVNANVIISVTAALVGVMLGLVFYLRSQSGDENYLLRSKWSVTIADGTEQVWFIDTESGGIKVVSSTDVGAETVEEFLDGKKHTYFRAATASAEMSAADKVSWCADVADYDGDCNTLHEVSAADSSAMAVEHYEDKEYCVSETWAAPKFSAVMDSASGTLSVGGFTVKFTDGVPTHIMVPPETLGGEYTVMATINSFEDYEGFISIVGCPAAPASRALTEEAGRANNLRDIKAIGDARRLMGEVSDEVMKAREYMNGALASMLNIHPDDHDEAARHLGLTAWMAGMSNSNYCGGGTDIVNTPCPCPTGSCPDFHGNYPDTGVIAAGVYDYPSDRACRKHDHGTKWKNIWGGMNVLLGCSIDHDLQKGTIGNGFIQTVYSNWGLSGAWGCSDQGSYNCWKWGGWYPKYGSYCWGENTRYGPWRYSGYKKTWAYMGSERPKSCPTDNF